MGSSSSENSVIAQHFRISSTRTIISTNSSELRDNQSSGKMRALEKLMSSWATRGDKILLFSYSVRMLDILEKFLIRKGYSFARLDGSTPTNLRQALVDDFNSSPSKQVFLISTRAGGLGLNLVSANRVVIFDPNWNPAQDLQAQDRSFRFGQKRHVVVFRLLAAGSFEEIIYSRQDCKAFQGELFGICNLFRDLSDKLFTNEIIEQSVEECIPEKNRRIKRRRKLDDTSGKENGLPVEDWKKKQCSLLAEFMAMEVLEFSKWVISATPSERKNLLRRFEKRKFKLPNG